MLGRSVGVVAACALSASAFLLPPYTIPTNSDLSLNYGLAELDSAVLRLSCPQCAFGSTQDKLETVDEGEDMVWIQGGAYDLLLNFTISQNGQQLLLGGEPIYPIRFRPGSLPLIEYRVSQVPSGVDTQDLQPEQITSLLVTGYNLLAEEMISKVKFDIKALNGRPMNVGSAEIALGKGNRNELVIVSTDALHIPQAELAKIPTVKGLFTLGDDKADHPKECRTLPAPLCDFKNMIEAHFANFKTSTARKYRPCPGSNGRGHGRPHHRPGHNGRLMRPHGRLHNMRPHGRHGHHRNHGFLAFLGAFARGFFAILVPTVAGFAVGAGVSLLGLLISRLICFTWLKFFGGARRGSYVEVPQDNIVLDGKTVIPEMEAPPVYEDAPAYEKLDKA